MRCVNVHSIQLVISCISHRTHAVHNCGMEIPKTVLQMCSEIAEFHPLVGDHHHLYVLFASYMHHKIVNPRIRH